MRISRVHVETDLVVGDKIAFDKDRAHYLKHVLRLKPGAAVDLFNGDGNDYRALLSMDGKTLRAEIGSTTQRDTESRIHTSVIQAIGKADHLDWMIQKTTELGVNRIVLFNAEHTQHAIKTVQLEKKQLHWRGVAISACEQCGRARVPEIYFHNALSEAMANSIAGLRLVLDFKGESLTAHLAGDASSIEMLIGPEGGLNQHELDMAGCAGFRPISLGSRVLRFETAAIAALAIVGSFT